MYIGTLCQMTGMVTTIASLFSSPTQIWTHRAWALVAAGSCVAMLLVGRYALVQWASTFMVVAFSICNVIAVAALQWTSFAISPAEFGHGLSFRIPEGQFLTAFGAFAITGVGAAEIIFYPIWCLEKGYAQFVGPRDGSAAWTARALGWMRVMRVDAWLSMAIYTVATAAFYLLGAAILHRQHLVVTNQTLVTNLSKIYEATFGAWGAWIFIVGAFMVLYSTLFVSLASNSRLFADVTGLLGVFRTREAATHQRITRAAIVGIAFFILSLYITWGEPIYLVTVGAVAQGVMLPFLGLAAVMFRRRVPPALRPGALWTMFLWISFFAMAAVGVYLAGKNLKLWA